MSTRICPTPGGADIYHPGDYKMYERSTTGYYYGDARTAGGLADADPSTDAEAVMTECIANLGATGGVVRMAPRTTLDFGDRVHVTTKIALIGGGPTTICRPATVWGGAANEPLFELDEEQGGASRQEDNVMANFQIDMRNKANTDAIHLHNVKQFMARNVQIRWFKRYGIYEESDNAQYTFATWLDRLFFESNGATSAIRAKDDGLGWLDSWFTNCWGNLVATTHGLYLGAAGNLDIKGMHWDFPTNPFYFHPNDDGQGGVVNDITLYHPQIDHAQGHGVYLNKANGNMTDIKIIDPHFIVTPNNFDMIHIDLAGTDLAGLQVHRATVSGAEAHEYFVNNDVVGLMDRCIFKDNMIPAGGTGTYNNVPTHMIINDLTDRTQYYQVIAGPGAANPTWVGTPPNGQICTQRNTAAGTSSGYHYSNGAWVLAWTV